MSTFVEHVVGQFDLLEGHGLFKELIPRERGVWVHVEPGWEGRVGLASHKPRGSVIGVTVSFVVHRNDIHQYRVLSFRLQAGE